MIRINLLATERKAEKKKTAAAPGAMQAYLILGACAGGAALLCGAGWWIKTAQLKELETRITEAEARQRQLQVIKKQVEDFEAKKKLINDKVQLIDKLKADQSASVHILDEISKALPEFVWLSAMDNTGAGVKLTGSSNSLSSVADFIANLQRSGWFPKVDLESSTEQNNIVAFVVNASFSNALARPSPPPTSAPAAGAPAGAPQAAAPAATPASPTAPAQAGAAPKKS